MKYLLVDTSNMFFRARHVAARGADSWSKVGMSLHITFNALLKTWRQVKPDHVIFCLEARSWRKSHTATYKRNRQDVKDAMNKAQQKNNKGGTGGFLGGLGKVVGGLGSLFGL